MYPFERFSDRAKMALAVAQGEAEDFRRSYMGTEHLLLGLLEVRDGIAARVLSNLGVEIDEVRSAVRSVLGQEERIALHSIAPTSRVNKVIEISFDECRLVGGARVGTEHLLCALLIEGEGLAVQILERCGVSLDNVYEEMARLAP